LRLGGQSFGHISVNGNIESSLSVMALDRHVSSVFHQNESNVSVALLAGEMERCRAIVVLGIYAGTFANQEANQEANGFRTTVLAGPMERCRAFIILDIYAGAFANQEANGFHVAVQAGPMERRVSNYILVVDIGTLLDKSFHFVEFSILGSDIELFVQRAHDDDDNDEEKIIA
jgi:hypothetical protein